MTLTMAHNNLLIGSKEIHGVTLVRMGIAWTKKFLKSSEQVNNAWGLYSEDILSSKCLRFEALVSKRTPHAIYEAVKELTGTVIADELKCRGEFGQVPLISTKSLSTLNGKRKERAPNSDDEAESYMNKRSKNDSRLLFTDLTGVSDSESD